MSDGDDIDNLINNIDYTVKDIDLNECDDLGNGIYVVSSIGQAPVEYAGIIDNACFYFKSRGNRWRMYIAPSHQQCLNEQQCLFLCECTIDGKPFSGSYLNSETAETLIRHAASLWRQSNVLTVAT